MFLSVLISVLELQLLLELFYKFLGSTTVTPITSPTPTITQTTTSASTTGNLSNYSASATSLSS
jgi:hypothetical protein